MYLKVENQSEEAVVYNLSKPELFIGSSHLGQILIPDGTLSKKHVKLINEENQWFIIDQGSTNGTFVNEEQIVPGKKTAISTDDSIRLGSKYFLTLLEEAKDAKELRTGDEPVPEVVTSAQSSTQKEEDKTRIISLDDMKKAKALADQKRAKELAQKRAQERKVKEEDQKRIVKIVFLCVLILAAGIYGNREWQNRKKSQPRKDTIVKKMKTSARATDEIVSDLEGFRIPRSALLTRNKIISHVKDKKCDDDKTMMFCVGKEVYSRLLNGILFLPPANFIIFIEETEIMAMSKKLLGPDSVLDWDSLQKYAFVYYMKTQFTEGLLEEKNHLYVSFYKINESEQPELTTVYAFPGSSGASLMELIKLEPFIGSDDEIKASLDKINDYFTSY